MTIAALEFATQGLAEDLQPSRSVGDGAAYYSESSLSMGLTLAWFAFVVLLNMAIIVPGLLLLQPIRLLRYLSQRRSAITPRQKFRRTCHHVLLTRADEQAGEHLISILLSRWPLR